MPKVDSHAHVFTRDLPIAPGARHRPDYDASVESYLDLLDGAGVSHALIAAPSFLGTDNSYLLSALAAHPDRLRGTVIVDPQIAPDEIAAMDAAGVVGIRLNLFKSAEPADLSSLEYKRLLGQLVELDWHVEVYVESERLPAALGPLLSSGVRIVVDHFGSPEAGVHSEGFAALLSAVEQGLTWTKLSAPYRLSVPEAAPYADALLRAGGPQRLLWGSDWPWTQHAEGKTFGGTLGWLEDWVPDPAARATILGDTPLRLFKFS